MSNLIKMSISEVTERKYKGGRYKRINIVKLKEKRKLYEYIR